jgi:hypothetical protein
LLETKEKMNSFEDRILNNNKKSGNMQEYKKELLGKIKELEKVRDSVILLFNNFRLCVN